MSEEEEQRRRSRCVVLVPIAHHTEPECEHGLVELEKRGYVVRRRPCHVSIDLGRSQMASEALAEGFDELMWIDADIGFNADDVERLRSQKEHAFICGIYPKRGVAELACRVKAETKEILFGEHGGLLEILYAGMGFCLVRRQVFVDVQTNSALPTCNVRTKSPFVPYFAPLVIPHNDGGSGESAESPESQSAQDDHWYLPEDYAFCERARRAGHPVFADTRIRLEHVGRYGYSWEDAMGDRERYRNVKMLLR